MTSLRHQTIRLASLVVLLTMSGVSTLSQDAGKAPGRGDAAASAPSQPEVHTTPTDPVQTQLVADTEKLSKLTKELRTELEKSKDTLSISVVKKAEEVEKLARSLKERMNKSQ